MASSQAPKATPTQVAHPWRATLRTAFSATLAALTVIGVALPILSEELSSYVPSALSEGMLWVAGLTVAITTALTRIMSIPKVNELLSIFGLSATPKQ